MPLTFDQTIAIELLKGAVAIITVVAVGGTVTAWWTRLQKQRETDMQELAKLYELYGTYLSLRRMWNCYAEKKADAPDTTTRWSFLQTATDTEGAFESLLVKVTSERRLSDDEKETLGHFRQSYQSLREAIRDNKPHNWNRSEDPQYVAFKTGATYLASLLGSARWWLRRPDAAKTLLEITSNKYETKNIDEQ